MQMLANPNPNHFSLPENLPPEILRTPLYEIIMILKLLKLGNPIAILERALYPPPIEAVQNAISFLIGNS